VLPESEQILKVAIGTSAFRNRVVSNYYSKKTRKSIIVRKLNSYARYTGIKKALIEYNTIFKSTHVLNLIDNMALRKAIRTARNRTENFTAYPDQTGNERSVVFFMCHI
jgi:TnpA family transposase